MKNYNKGDRGESRGGGFRGDRGERPSFQKKSWGNERGGDRETTLHKATCSECGKSCEVPFRPTGDKPVYCSNCFTAKRNGDDRGGRPSSTSYDSKRSSNEKFTPVNPFVRQESKPVSSQVDDSMKKQLSDISFKLDKLINAIERMSTVKKEVHVQVQAPVKTVVASAVKHVVQAKKVVVKKVVQKAVVKVAVKKAVAKAPVKAVAKVVAKVAPKKAVVKTVVKKVIAKKK